MVEMLEKTAGYICSEELEFWQESEELSAMVKDSYAHYYIKRSKPSASYQYLIAAMNIYKRRNDAINVAKCRLHQSFIQCAQHNYGKLLFCCAIFVCKPSSVSLTNNHHTIRCLIEEP